MWTQHPDSVDVLVIRNNTRATVNQQANVDQQGNVTHQQGTADQQGTAAKHQGFAVN